MLKSKEWSQRLRITAKIKAYLAKSRYYEICKDYQNAKKFLLMAVAIKPSLKLIKRLSILEKSSGNILTAHLIRAAVVRKTFRLLSSSKQNAHRESIPFYSNRNRQTKFFKELTIRGTKRQRYIQDSSQAEYSKAA